MCSVFLCCASRQAWACLSTKTPCHRCFSPWPCLDEEGVGASSFVIMEPVVYLSLALC